MANASAAVQAGEANPAEAAGSAASVNAPQNATPISTNFAASFQGGGNGVTAAPGGGVTPPKVPISNATPIPADQIGTTPKAVTVPQTPNTPTPQPTVAAPAGTTANKDGTVTPNPPETSTANPTNDSIKTSLQQMIGELGNEGNVQNNLNTAEGVDQKTQQATQDYNTYIAAKQQLANQISNIQANSTGMSKEAVDEAVQQASRIGNANVSNLALQSSISQGNLTAAEKIVSDKMTAQFQPIKDSISALESFNTINNNDLTESQSKAIDAKAAQLKTETDTVQTASTDAHTALMKGHAPTSAYSKLDDIFNQWEQGKLTVQQAQTQMDEVASPYVKDVNATGDLSTSDVQSGAVKAGVDAKTFSSLDPDVQNWFAKASAPDVKVYTDALTGVQSGNMSADDANTAINALNLDPTVKAYMQGQITANTPTAPASSGPNAFQKFFGWLGSKITGATDLGGGQGNQASTTVMTNPADGQQYNVPNDKVEAAKSGGWK